MDLNDHPDGKRTDQVESEKEALKEGIPESADQIKNLSDLNASSSEVNVKSSPSNIKKR